MIKVLIKIIIRIDPSYVLGIFFLLFNFQLFAQTTSAKIDKDQIVLGEQVNLEVKITNIDKSVSIDKWFTMPDTGNHIEVIERKKIDTIDTGNNTYELTQNIIITSFDSGKWAVPITAPVLVDNQGVRYPQNIDSARLIVNPVDVSHMQDFHDIKDVVNVHYRDYKWLYYTAAAILLLLLIWFIIRWVKKRKKTPTRQSIVKGPPLEWALKEINLLQQQNLINQNQELQYFTRLDEICRTYYDEKTHSNTHYLTAKETFEKLRKYLQQEKDRVSLFELNKLNDAVKFAKYKPSQDQADKAADMAKNTLQKIEVEIEKQKQTNNQKQNLKK